MDFCTGRQCECKKFRLVQGQGKHWEEKSAVEWDKPHQAQEIHQTESSLSQGVSGGSIIYVYPVRTAFY